MRSLFCFCFQANDGGLIQNLVRMTTTRLLSDDFEIMLPINQVRARAHRVHPSASPLVRFYSCRGAAFFGFFSFFCSDIILAHVVVVVLRMCFGRKRRPSTSMFYGCNKLWRMCFVRGRDIVHGFAPRLQPERITPACSVAVRQDRLGNICTKCVCEGLDLCYIGTCTV